MILRYDSDLVGFFFTRPMVWNSFIFCLCHLDVLFVNLLRVFQVTNRTWNNSMLRNKCRPVGYCMINRSLCHLSFSLAPKLISSNLKSHRLFYMLSRIIK